MPTSYKEEILALKEKKNAIILAHYYQRDEIQEIADFRGDSLKLSQLALNTKANIIVFCGVHFMAETAKILSPHKKVLLPVMNAGCRMADMITPEKLIEYKKRNPETKIITYINSSAEIKALSDCICTSSNGVKIIKHYLDQGERILYTPDQNLGTYAMKLTGKTFDIWNGFCPLHHYLDKNAILRKKQGIPEALIIAHPECPIDILEISDFVGSTAQLISFVHTSPAKKFIVCTENGVLYSMKKDNPDKEFIIASKSLYCPNMKKTHLKDVYDCLLNESNDIYIDEVTRKKAMGSLNKMLELS